jgi:DNA-binding transcriptional ArsR family regulator
MSAGGSFPESERLSFALAVAQPDTKAGLYDAHNQLTARESIPRAVAKDRTFFVETSNDILALDVDDLAQKAELLELADKMRASGLTPVISNSGQGLHLYARNAPESFAQRARECRFDVRRDIRPIGVRHRLGKPQSLLAPTGTGDALAALGAPGLRPLTPKMQMLLSTGQHSGRDRSRSALVHAFAGMAMVAGWSEADAFVVAWLNPLLRSRLDQSKDPQSYFRRSWHKIATTCPTVYDRGAVYEWMARVRDAAAGSRWKGKGGASDYVTLLAHIEIAQEKGKLNYHAGVRDVAQYAGLGRATVSRANRRLRESGWLRLVKGRADRWDGRAFEWELCIPETCDAIGTLISPTGGCVESVPVTSSDIWRWKGRGDGGGLGKTAYRVWSACRLSPLTTAELAEHFGVTVRTTERHLEALREHDLVEKLPDGRWEASDPDHESLARMLGVLGQGERQARQDLIHREGYRDAVVSRGRRSVATERGAAP